MLLMLESCKTKRVLEKSPLVPLGDNALLELVQASTFDFATLNGKLSISANTSKQSGSFRANLRMGADSLIWMSITPALGIEAARVLVSQDSLKFIDKIKNQYYLGPFDLLDALFNHYTEFDLVQNLLIGNPIQIDPEEKYVSGVDDLQYVLKAKTKRKVRKSVERGESIQGIPYLGVVKERKYEKAIEKYDEEDLILKTYFIHPKTFKVEAVAIDDILYKRSLMVRYSNFEDVEGQSFPMNISIEIASPEQSATFELSYSRIRINESQSYPFRIPERYEAIR